MSIIRVLTTEAVRDRMRRDVGGRRSSGAPRRGDAGRRQQFWDYRLPTGRRRAKARGITGYRVVTPPGRPDVRIRVALTKRPGPRGGRSVAVARLERR